MWASFWNRVPLNFIERNGYSFSLTDFEVIAAQDLFESGRKVIGVDV